MINGPVKSLYENIIEYVSTLPMFTSEVWTFSSETNMSRPVVRVGDFHAGHIYVRHIMLHHL